MRLAAFTDSGYFWLPGDEDRIFQVPGTLAVSEAGRVTLETFGIAATIHCRWHTARLVKPAPS